MCGIFFVCIEFVVVFLCMLDYGLHYTVRNFMKFHTLFMYFSN